MDDILLDKYVLDYAKFYHLQVDDLCLCNDFATTFIIDAFYDITTFKFNPRTSPGFMLGTVPREVQRLIREHLSFFRADGCANSYKKIMIHASHFADCCNFKSKELRHVALEYVKMYLHAFNRKSNFLIEPSSHHYQGEEHLTSLRVTATKGVRAGCGVIDLVMFTKYLRKMPRRWESYSIDGHYIGVGPLMYANHSCLNNAEYVSHRTLNKRLRFIWVSSLSVREGHELTVNYGTEYFKDMICECEKCRPRRFTLAWFSSALVF